jgi:hypothetical protein
LSKGVPGLPERLSDPAASLDEILQSGAGGDFEYLIESFLALSTQNLVQPFGGRDAAGEARYSFSTRETRLCSAADRTSSLIRRRVIRLAEGT